MSKTAKNTDKSGGQVHPMVMPSPAGKQAKFREELVKIMPGYKWTVHKPLFKDASFLEAIGIQSSGFNRLSTMKVTRRETPHDTADYEVMYAGSGTKSPWLSSAKNGTLARALRHLQEFFEGMARTYAGAANDMQKARKA
jgi:hypothetical protein